jgi:hypothetical protein
MTQREKLEARLKELDAKIAAHPHWGAVLTAMEEERRGILAALNGEGRKDEDC